MKTRCICGFRFELVIKKRMISEDIQDIFYECPHCEEKIHIAYTNSEIRRHNEEMQKVRDSLLKDKSNNRLLEQIRVMMIQQKEMMNKINGGV
jgi:hypothetical protein